MTKPSAAITFLFLIVLSACAGGNISNTATPVSSNNSVIGERQPPSDHILTPTLIPPPSPTPTLTPIATLAPELSQPSPIPLLISTPKAEVIIAALNIRQGPGLDYPIVGVAQAGDEFEIIGVNFLGDWLQVATHDGNTGWISGQIPYTRLLATELDDLPIVPSPRLTSTKTITAETTSTGSYDDLQGKLIFMTGSGGDLYRIDANGRGLRQLTSGVIDPVVSPDGQQVAFTRWDGAEFGALYTINIDGTNERAIVGDIRQPKSPTWSPDGEQIVISFQHGGLRDPGKTCRNFKPGQEINLPDSRITVTRFHVSRNGEIDICYLPFEDLHWQLRLIDVTTGRFEDLPSDEYSYNPAWDLRNPWRVLYDGNKGIMQLDVTNGQQWPITKDLRDTGPVFSPDGKTLALTYKQHDHWEIYTLNLETGERRRLTKPPILADPQYNSASPAWSPDGSHIAFVTDRTGLWEIWVMAADGSNPHPLFLPEVQAQFTLEYHGVNERMLNWIE